MTGAADLKGVGAVVIGRNEGQRLMRCFDSLPAQLRCVVYVDSGSVDGSVERAEARGVAVVRLDLTRPFTAARARNAGVEHLTLRYPGVRLIQFVDGDCELQPGWMENAVAAMERLDRVAVVSGRLRERFPRATVYNRLCDLEWDGPLGEVFSCGGLAMMRVDSFRAAGGFRESLIAGEEPDLCVRLRLAGHRIWRLPDEMALHDAAMTHFGQWWTRSIRAGYGTAELATIHPAYWGRETLSVAAWGLILPALAVLAGLLGTPWLGLAMLLAYPIQGARILARRRAGGLPFADAALYASACLLSKFPQFIGAGRYVWLRALGRRGALIEHRPGQA